MNNNSYLGGLLNGICSLLTGMKTTITVFCRRKVTEQYPENRKELVMFDRFRGTLLMPHDADGQHRCIGCGLCQLACPNNTIRISTETVETEEGKKKKRLVRYEYDLGSCMFCQLCVNACPHDAIKFGTEFEHAVFDRSKLIKCLSPLERGSRDTIKNNELVIVSSNKTHKELNDGHILN